MCLLLPRVCFIQDISRDLFREDLGQIILLWEYILAPIWRKIRSVLRSRFSTALWVPFGIVFGVPASPSKKRMENEGLWRSSTVHLNSFGANVGHVGNIFAYRCFLFAVPMLRVCRAAPLKSRFRSQDIITAFPVTSWEPPRRHLGHFISL